jgi:hypothetical protein
MKSKKQRREETKSRRAVLKAKRSAIASIPANALPVAPHLLAQYNTYSWSFSEDGYYRPHKFSCKDCGVAEVWAPAQQKWWFEKVRAEKYKTAIRCSTCRAKERARKMEARAASAAGLLRKLAKRKLNEEQ